MCRGERERTHVPHDLDSICTAVEAHTIQKAHICVLTAADVGQGSSVHGRKSIVLYTYEFKIPGHALLPSQATTRKQRKESSKVLVRAARVRRSSA